jgi:hypothetical protein
VHAGQVADAAEFLIGAQPKPGDCQMRPVSACPMVVTLTPVFTASSGWVSP